MNGSFAPYLEAGYGPPTYGLGGSPPLNESSSQACFDSKVSDDLPCSSDRGPTTDKPGLFS